MTGGHGAGLEQQLSPPGLTVIHPIDVRRYRHVLGLPNTWLDDVPPLCAASMLTGKVAKPLHDAVAAGTVTSYVQTTLALRSWAVLRPNRPIDVYPDVRIRRRWPERAVLGVSCKISDAGTNVLDVDSSVLVTLADGRSWPSQPQITNGSSRADESPQPARARAGRRIGTSEILVTPVMTESFAAVTGDDNPVHFGTSGAPAIVHGLAVAALVVDAVAGFQRRTPAGESDRLADLSFRFAGPILVGETVGVSIHTTENPGTKVVVCESVGGRVLTGHVTFDEPDRIAGAS